MLHDLSCGQLDKWWAFFLREPWGWSIDNHRGGQLCAVIANSSGNLKKPRKASDYYLKTH